jgi:hypothetical protein
MPAPTSLTEIMHGPHRQELVDDGDDAFVMVEALRFVPVYDFQPDMIVARPVDDWRAYAMEMGRLHGKAA